MNWLHFSLPRLLVDLPYRDLEVLRSSASTLGECWLFFTNPLPAWQQRWLIVVLVGRR